MKRCVFLICALLIVSVAMGYDPLYTEDGAALLEHMQLRAGASVNFGSSSAYFDDEGEKHDFVGDASMTNLYIPVRVGIGIAKMLEFQFLIPFMSMKYSNGSEITGSGISDSWITAKAGIASGGINFAGRIGLQLPTGNDDPDIGDFPTGSGRTDLDIGVLLAYRPEERTGFAADFNAGYRINTEKDDYNYGDFAPFNIRAGYQVTEVLFPYAIIAGKLGLSNDEYNGIELEDTKESVYSIGAGAVFKSDMGLGVYGNILYDIAGKNNYAGMDINVGVEFLPKLGN